jgi:predicted nucleic acid-binding protein
MASKVFIDANIILEHSLGREKFDEVRKIFLLIEDGDIKAYTTTSILQTCGYVLLKYYGSVTIKKILLGLLNLITVIDYKHDIIVVAINSSFSDFEDAIQYYTALEHKIDYYLTLDKRLIKEATPQLPALSPKSFLNN